MPRPAAPPRTPAQWLERLAAVRLPWLSPPHVLQRMLGANISVRDLLTLLEADLPLAAEVIVSAGRALHASGKSLQGLQHAVNLLGIERVQGLIRSRREAALDLALPTHQAALQAMASTRLACLFANHWTASHSGTDPEPLIWNTALLGLARWKLPLAAPHEAAEIERRVSAGERRATAERDLLGTTLDALTPAHLAALGLPPVAQRLPTRALAVAARFAWTGATAPEVPSTCLQALQQPGAVCWVAQGLALAVQDSWYSGRTRTWMAVAAVQLNQPRDKLRADLLQLALHASQELSFTHTLVAPAARLLWPPPRPRQLRQTGHGRVVPTAQTHSKTQPAPNPGHDSHQDRPQDLRALLLSAVQTLTQTLGLRRCALFLKASDGPHLGCVFAQGFEGTAIARGLTVTVDDGHLTQRLLQHPGAFLWVRSTQTAAARQHLPELLAPLVPEAGLALGVVDVGGQPKGLWWADTGGTDRALDTATCAAFKQFTRSFGADFTRLARPASPPATQRRAAATEPA